MTVAPNTILGRYEIISLIGAGGMGEVYRAKDPRLGRDVAIKVLPADFSTDADRLRRFEQEAQAAGTLNHPSILSIYDVASHNGSLYVVSELLEGETLGDRLDGEALPLRKAIEYALQIASGLAAAHEKGVVHRDLKPDNVFVTKDDRVKILDFGLAKLVEQKSEIGGTDMPTRKALTNPGAVMGTPGYMSPEQVRGKPVDHRSDIFSFGAVLYEMLSGKRAFTGETAIETLNAILKEEPPDISATNGKVTPGLDRVIRRCIEKHPEHRFHSASDLGFALETLSDSRSSGSTAFLADAQITGEQSQLHGRRGGLPGWLGWTAAAVFLLSTIAIGALYFGRSDRQAGIVRFSIAPPGRADLGGTLSPDGRQIAFVVTNGQGVTSLWVRSLGELDARQLAGTEDAGFPFWSPDSRFIGFFAGNKLKRIEAVGGSAQSLADASAEARGGAWGAEGVILFTTGFSTPLLKVTASGGVPVPVTQLDASRNEISHRWPSFLPDGRNFLYYSRATDKEAEGIYVGSLDGGDGKFLLNSTARAAYSPSPYGSGGFLLFMRDTTLLAQPFDADALELSGEPSVIAEGVLTFPGEAGPTAYAAFSASANGHLIYLTGKEPMTQLSWFDRTGNTAGPIVPPGDYHEPWVSPDGTRIAFGREGGSDRQDIWLLEVARGIISRFTLDPASEVCPLFSVDASRIFFSSSRAGKMQLYQKPSGGAGTAELLLASDSNAFADDSSSDGRYLLYEIEDPKTSFDLFVLPFFGERVPSAYLQTEFNETHARFSPDGKFVAYVSDESGRTEVYVQTFPVSGSKWQISIDGGDQPQWRGDGKELFYLSQDKKLMAVPVMPGDSFGAGTPANLFTTQVPTTGLTDDRNNYFSTPDGKRFLVNNLVDDVNARPATMVLNWATDLKK
ncbi:MAG: protein kinase [Pyrinomonadaceae bacterium]